MMLHRRSQRASLRPDGSQFQPVVQAWAAGGLDFYPSAKVVDVRIIRPTIEFSGKTSGPLAAYQTGLKSRG
jgi:hypothetical protein